MAKPKVLIVGCGAVGLSQGYHISSAADITYLVRPGRKSAFAPPKNLYSYKENDLYIFSSYRVIESVAEVAGETFAFIFDTLDGHTARSDSGIATLHSVGNLIKEAQNTDCFLIYDALGLDMEDHYARTTRIATSRLFLAESMLAHQPTSRISVPLTANKDLVMKTDILYSCFSPNVGLLAFNTQPALTKKLESVYNANGKLAVQRVPAFVSSWVPLLNMLHMMAWYVDGFGSFERLRKNSDLWALLLRAQSEILTLPHFGWTGSLLSFVVRGWATEKANMLFVEGAKPMSYEEFNAFHHGAKVIKQDLRVLEDVINEGDKSGKKMKALREVVRRAAQLQL